MVALLWQTYDTNNGEIILTVQFGNEFKRKKSWCVTIPFAFLFFVEMRKLFEESYIYFSGNMCSTNRVFLWLLACKLRWVQTVRQSSVQLSLLHFVFIYQLIATCGVVLDSLFSRNDNYSLRWILFLQSSRDSSLSQQFPFLFLSHPFKCYLTVILLDKVIQNTSCTSSFDIDMLCSSWPVNVTTIPCELHC